MKPLHEHRAEIVASVLGSTTTRAVEVAEYLSRALAASAARAAAAASSSRKHSEKLRSAIRLACGALPLDHANTPFAIMDRIDRRPHAYGLEVGPSEDTVRAELRAMQTERKPVPASLPSTLTAAYRCNALST